MDFNRLSKLTMLTLVVLFAWTSGVFAGGGVAGEGCWMVERPSNGAIALSSTISVVYTPSEIIPTPENPEPLGNIDAIIRVQRGSDMAFFRTNIQGNLFQNTDELIGGKLLNSCIYVLFDGTIVNPDAATAADVLAGKILDHFFSTDRPEMELVITGKSVSNTDYNGDDVVRAILDTGRAAGIADITLYAIDAFDN